MNIEYARITTKDGNNENCVAYDFNEQILYNFEGGYVTPMDYAKYEGIKMQTVKNARGKWNLDFWSETV